MKLLIFSDSHGNTERMKAVIRRTPADAVVHLGDGFRDIEAVRDELGEDYERRLRYFRVRGNCDFFLGGAASPPEELTVELGGVRFLLLHGHTRHVKHGTALLENYARGIGADIVLFGHTHEVVDRWLPGEGPTRPLRLFNPGSIGAPAGCDPRYGYIEIRNGQALTNIADFREEMV